MFYLICAWINAWVNNGEAGDFRRHRTQYDVIVIDIHHYIIVGMETWSTYRDTDREGILMVDLCWQGVLNVKVPVITVHAIFKVVYVVSSFKAYTENV